MWYFSMYNFKNIYVLIPFFRKSFLKITMYWRTSQLITTDSCLIVLWVHQVHFLVSMTEMIATEMLLAPVFIPNAGDET